MKVNSQDIFRLNTEACPRKGKVSPYVVYEKLSLIYPFIPLSIQKNIFMHIYHDPPEKQGHMPNHTHANLYIACGFRQWQGINLRIIPYSCFTHAYSSVLVLCTFKSFRVFFLQPQMSICVSGTSQDANTEPHSRLLSDPPLPHTDSCNQFFLLFSLVISPSLSPFFFCLSVCVSPDKSKTFLMTCSQYWRCSKPHKQIFFPLPPEITALHKIALATFISSFLQAKPVF